MKRHLILVAAVLVISHSSPAADLFWSGDGLTEGGAGTWDTTTARFGTSSGGPFTTVWTNANSDNVTFEATAGTVTLSIITNNGTLTDNSGYTSRGYLLHSTWRCSDSSCSLSARNQTQPAVVG